MAIVAQGLEHWFVVPRVEGSIPFGRPFLQDGILRVSTIEAIILGIIQGLTEFLPVSSSGHLTLAQHLLGFKDLDHYIVFDLTCHMGTLFAILYVFKDHIRNLFTGDRTKLYQIVIGTLPLFPIILILKQIESIYNKIHLLGFFFLLTAFLLWAGIKWGWVKSETNRKQSWIKDALTIGAFQTLALLPGVSRSGSTISSARLLGWKSEDAISFSFLLAIPAILGGTALKLMQLIASDESLQQSISINSYIAGFTTSFIVGIFALLLLMRLVAKEKMMYFVWYCLFLGIGTLFYLS